MNKLNLRSSRAIRLIRLRPAFDFTFTLLIDIASFIMSQVFFVDPDFSDLFKKNS